MLITPESQRVNSRMADFRFLSSQIKAMNTI